MGEPSAARDAGAEGIIRPCRPEDGERMLAIINAAAEAYREAIPADRWREPYMPGVELQEEIAAGVAFWSCEVDGELAGVMGVQPVGDVDLIRHAYVAPEFQGLGIGGRLLKYLVNATPRPMLVGTWAAATWAIGFYERHGFRLASPPRTASLLRIYWRIPERQIETSVVLANPPIEES